MKRKRDILWDLIWVLIVASLFGMLITPVSYAQGESDGYLVPLLKQLYVPGVLGSVVGVVLSYAVEFVPKFKELTPKKKRLGFFLACLVVSTLAGVGLAAILSTWNWDAILGKAVVVTLAACSVGTLAHTPRLPDGS